jgi:OOP family OmpA-OmpF porin
VTRQRIKLSKRARLEAIAICACVASVGSHALATSLARDPAPPGDAAYIVQGADARGHHRVRFGATIDYSREPLVVLDASQRFERLVIEQLWAHALTSYAFAERFLFWADLPLLITQSGPVDTTTALGDLRLGARARLLGPAREAPTLCLGAELWTPTGADTPYVGENGWRAGPFVSVGEDAPLIAWSATLGATFRPGERFEGALTSRVGSAVVAAAAARVAVDPARTLRAGPELRAELVFGEGARLLDPRSTGLELLLGADWRIAGGPLVIGAAGGPGVGQLAGTPDYRLAARVVFSPEAPPRPPDEDEDGIADASDACPDLRGERSGDPQMNGCPPLPPDRDDDSIPDAYDACPLEPGDPTGIRSTHGCPKGAQP